MGHLEWIILEPMHWKQRKNSHLFIIHLSDFLMETFQSINLGYPWWTPSLAIRSFSGLPTFSFRLQYTNFTLGVARYGKDSPPWMAATSLNNHSQRSSRVCTDAQTGPQIRLPCSSLFFYCRLCSLSIFVGKTEQEKEKRNRNWGTFDLLLALVESMMRSFPHAAVSSQQRGVGSILGKEGNDVLSVAPKTGWETSHESIHYLGRNFPGPRSIWVFPKIGVPQNGWFIRENPI